VSSTHARVFQKQKIKNTAEANRETSDEMSTQNSQNATKWNEKIAK
jgi:hypothetical protein